MPQPTNATNQLDLHPLLHNERVNVKAFGALGDGSTDDTTAIHAARDAAPDGGTVFFPPGHYVVSSLNWNRNLTVAGAGWWARATDAFANAHWGSGQYGTWYGGTVIRSTDTSTRGMLAATADKRVHMRDFMVLGPGTGTSNGIELGTAAISALGMDVRNIGVSNFGGAGGRLFFVEDGTFAGVKVRGCKTGLSLSDASNQNTFLQTEVQTSDTDAVLLATSTAMNRFYGGLMQSCTGNGANISGSGNRFDGFYMENTGITKAVWFKAGGDHSFANSYMSTAAEAVQIDATQCVLGPLRKGAGGYVITINTAGACHIDFVSGATITTNGNFYTGRGASDADNTLGRARTAVIATASLAAANAVWNGYMVIEDAGAGDRNLIIYAGGQRFRIDGGTNF